MSEVFPCTGCGACCRSVRLSELTASFDRGDGTCRHFDDIQNACTIYDDRPDICNIHRSYDQHYASQVSWPEFVRVNKIACDELMKQFDGSEDIGNL